MNIPELTKGHITFYKQISKYGYDLNCGTNATHGIRTYCEGDQALKSFKDQEYAEGDNAMIFMYGKFVLKALVARDEVLKVIKKYPTLLDKEDIESTYERMQLDIKTTIKEGGQKKIDALMEKFPRLEELLEKQIA